MLKFWIWIWNQITYQISLLDGSVMKIAYKYKLNESDQIDRAFKVYQKTQIALMNTESKKSWLQPSCKFNIE